LRYRITDRYNKVGRPHSTDSGLTSQIGAELAYKLTTTTIIIIIIQLATT